MSEHIWIEKDPSKILSEISNIGCRSGLMKGQIKEETDKLWSDYRELRDKAEQLLDRIKKNEDIKNYNKHMIANIEDYV